MARVVLLLSLLALTLGACRADPTPAAEAPATDRVVTSPAASAPAPARHGVTVHRQVPFTPAVRCQSSGATCRLTMDVYAPRTGGPWPVVVLLAGGPKPPGGQGYVSRAARPIAERGAVVMTAEWRQAAEYGGGWQASFRDVACAVGVARRTADEYGGRPDRVVLVGHSLGGWAAAVVALTPEPFTPGHGQCARTAGSLRPDGLVTLAGAVDEVTHQGLGAAYLTAFFHGTRAQRPDAWAAADPFSLVRAHRPDASAVAVTVVRGGRDTVVTPSAGPALHRALRRAGYRSRLVDVARADHNGLLDAPKAVAAVAAALR